VLCGVAWCCVVLHDAAWCCVMQCDAEYVLHMCCECVACAARVLRVCYACLRGCVRFVCVLRACCVRVACILRVRVAWCCVKLCDVECVLPVRCAWKVQGRNVDRANIPGIVKEGAQGERTSPFASTFNSGHLFPFALKLAIIVTCLIPGSVRFAPTKNN